MSRKCSLKLRAEVRLSMWRLIANGPKQADDLLGAQHGGDLRKRTRIPSYRARLAYAPAHFIHDRSPNGFHLPGSHTPVRGHAVKTRRVRELPRVTGESGHVLVLVQAVDLPLQKIAFRGGRRERFQYDETSFTLIAFSPAGALTCPHRRSPEGDRKPPGGRVGAPAAINAAILSHNQYPTTTGPATPTSAAPPSRRRRRGS